MYKTTKCNLCQFFKNCFHKVQQLHIWKKSESFSQYLSKISFCLYWWKLCKWVTIWRSDRQVSKSSFFRWWWINGIWTWQPVRCVNIVHLQMFFDSWWHRVVLGQFPQCFHWLLLSSFCIFISLLLLLLLPGALLHLTYASHVSFHVILRLNFCTKWPITITHFKAGQPSWGTSRNMCWVLR